MTKRAQYVGQRVTYSFWNPSRFGCTSYRPGHKVHWIDDRSAFFDAERSPVQREITANESTGDSAKGPGTWTRSWIW